MSAFLASTSYSPDLVLVVGLLAFAGFLALGEALLRAVGFEIPSPWRQVAALVLGVQATSLLVQVLAMTDLASPGALASIASGLLAAGGLRVFSLVRDNFPATLKLSDGAVLLPKLAVALAAATALLVALAPSTKIDEIYYHMLVPSRILADGALRFYAAPWEGAILPQMIFQIATTPLHAIHCPDAGNVIGWLFGMSLLWFAWRIACDSGKPSSWAFLWVGALAAGLYAVVWHVTAGAHAIGALTLAAATVAFCGRHRLAEEIGPSRFATLFSVLALGAGSTKVTLLPLVAVMMLAVGWPILRDLKGTQRRKAALGLVLPWAIFLLPITCWTWAASGAPFGPILSDWFAPTVFEPGWTAALFEEARAANEESLARVLLVAATDYSPLLYVAMLGALFHTVLAKRVRLELGSLLAFQGALILLLLLPNMRYFGGLHYGLAIVFAAHAKDRLVDFVSSRRVIAVLAATLLMPWIAVQLYYAHQFFPSALGIQAKDAFYERYIAFYRDYQALELVLPRNASIFTPLRAGFVYAPRPVFLEPDDLPANRPVYALIPKDNLALLGKLLPGYRQVKVVYENAHAISAAYRTPGRRPLVEAIVVVKMAPDQASAIVASPPAPRFQSSATARQ